MSIHVHPSPDRPRTRPERAITKCNTNIDLVASGRLKTALEKRLHRAKARRPATRIGGSRRHREPVALGGRAWRSRRRRERARVRLAGESIFRRNLFAEADMAVRPCPIRTLLCTPWVARSFRRWVVKVREYCRRGVILGPYRIIVSSQIQGLGSQTTGRPLRKRAPPRAPRP